MQTLINGQTLELVEGDITEQQVDAIVNAANSRLAGGAGVDGAIHRRGGPEIMVQTDRDYPDGCPTGSAVITSAGQLPADFVIHAVGPIWNGGSQNEAASLAGAYRRCLELAVENNCQSVALPAISCGIYSYPVEQASQIALTTVIEFQQQHAKPALVRFVLFGQEMYGRFAETLAKLT